ncbi:radical SAM protein [Enterocloster citroniae]|uniref:radical SAM protein n=1 Tax=Enterocloster citroniae TaxID=358743 RepID=UPI00349E9ECF
MNQRIPIPFDRYTACTLCPRACSVNRLETTGYCGCGHELKAARAALHHWEEPCISGPEQERGGSGTVFFSGCTLRCCFCQNWELSSDNFGKVLTAEELAQIFLNLESQGAYNINLVTPTQYLPHITYALDMVRDRLTIPVVYNCGGYETAEMILALKDYVDIWLPDFKYYDNRLALKYSRASDYFEQSSAAIRQMIRQTGAPVWQDHNPDQDHLPGQESVSSFPLLKKGVIIRHMVLPGHKDDSIALLHWMKDHLPEGRYLISLMSQYTPFHHSSEYPGLNRRITTYEYNRVVDTAIELGLTQGFMQQKSSAREEYTPPFDLEGL